MLSYGLFAPDGRDNPLYCLGIVGCTLAHVGCEVIMTDMEVALDVPQYNVERAPQHIKERIQCKPLLW